MVGTAHKTPAALVSTFANHFELLLRQVLEPTKNPQSGFTLLVQRLKGTGVRLVTVNLEYLTEIG